MSKYEFNFVNNTFGVYPEPMIEKKDLPACIGLETNEKNNKYCFCNKKQCPATKCGFRGEINSRFVVDNIGSIVWTRYVKPEIIKRNKIGFDT